MYSHHGKCHNTLHTEETLEREDSSSFQILHPPRSGPAKCNNNTRVVSGHQCRSDRHDVHAMVFHLFMGLVFIFSIARTGSSESRRVGARAWIDFIKRDVFQK